MYTHDNPSLDIQSCHFEQVADDARTHTHTHVASEESAHVCK